MDAGKDWGSRTQDNRENDQLGQGKSLSVWLSSDTSKAIVGLDWVTYWKIVQVKEWSLGKAERCMW